MSDKLKDRFLVCIDSDGCAIDSMTIKHEKAFGPAFIDIWKIDDAHRQTILEEWNTLNLYSLSRGINRFQGLLAILKAHPEYIDADQLKLFDQWVETTRALSAASLQQAYEETGADVMKNALSWSELVNKKIAALPLAKSFEGVLETIRLIKEKADIAVVSSANLEAIKEEWEASGLYDYVDHVFSQSDGTKSKCIHKLIQSGYDRKKTIMLGDALGDHKAAEENQVWFYPILAAKESASWNDFRQNYFSLFLNQKFDTIIQDRLLLQMKENLS